MSNAYGKRIDELPAGIALAAGQKIPILQSGLVRQVDVATLLGGGSGLVDGDYGDVTVSAAGSTITIDAGAVTTTKLGGDITAAGKALLDDADAAAQRFTLGLGSLATQSGTFSGTFNGTFSGTSSGTNTGDQNIFSSIAVSGQTTVAADTTSDTLTLVAGANVTITTDAAADTITIAATGGSGTPAGSSGQIQFNSSSSFGAMSGTSWNDTRRSLRIDGATVTDNSDDALYISRTWNSGSSTQTLVRLVVTDTSSGGVSRFLNCERDGTSVFSIRKDGAIIAGSFQSNIPVGTAFGGTGLNGYATGDVIYASGASTLAKRAIGSTNALLTVVGGVPVWRAPTIHQRSISANTTLDLTDWGGHVYHPSSDTTARTVTIPANASVAYDIGAAITFVNDVSAGVLTIAIDSDTLVLSPDGTTGSRALAAGGMATAIKVTATRWVISGPGLT